MQFVIITIMSMFVFVAIMNVDGAKSVEVARNLPFLSTKSSKSSRSKSSTKSPKGSKSSSSITSSSPPPLAMAECTNYCDLGGIPTLKPPGESNNCVCLCPEGETTCDMSGCVAVCKCPSCNMENCRNVCSCTEGCDQSKCEAVCSCTKGCDQSKCEAVCCCDAGDCVGGATAC